MSDDEHLSRIDTLWSVVRKAHSPEDSRAAEAQELLLERYGGAVRRYLCACLRDRDAADEVFQEFALRFVRGDFRSADPSRGRFRSFLKTTVYRLMIDYRRRKGRDGRQQALGVDPEARPEADDPLAASDDVFLSSWRDELLARTWRALEEYERTSGTACYTALRMRVDAPELRSAELATRLSERLGRPVTPENARVLVHRARERFAEHLLDAVANSLDGPSPEAIEEELIDLRLLDYCRDALHRRR
ncbi:MAG TPA: sigma-70 family RNA polymerase sigma factor [Planctomycetaceae bacterium]